MTSARVDLDEAGPERPEESREISLYEKWRKLYPLWVKGRFQRARRRLLVLLLLVFYVSPWITWNGKQAFWLDIPGRRFTIFFTTFYPQEFVLLSWLLIIAAFTLFFVTVVAGRIWCGYACPQTVWTLCFQWIEKWIEGERNQRLRLDNGPWNARRIGKKALKWSLWALLALSIGFTFVGYFVPPAQLIHEILYRDIGGWERFWIYFPAVGSFLLSGVLREQVCIHMCPYARFQSVMFDKDTLIIAYDESRGEPRGNRPRSADPAARGLGSCVDCKLCVNACPTGIDIRDGLQYECIGCAQCIDVCNGVMTQMGYAPNLIRYSSEHHDRHEVEHKVRPRLFGYGVVLTAMLVAFTLAVWTRVPLAIDIIRDRNRLYREVWDGSVENVYKITIMNRQDEDRTFKLSADSVLPVELRTRLEDDLVTVAGGGQLTLAVRLLASPGPDTAENTPVEFTVESVDEPRYSITETSRFLVPAREHRG